MPPPDIADHRSRLVRLCTRLTGDAQAAEDLAQEALLVALRHDQERRLPDDWAPWLTGVARMLCRNWRSRHAEQARRTSGSLTDIDSLTDSHAEDPLDALLAVERGDLLECAFTKIDAPARRLLAARYLDDMPLDEIAGNLGLTPNAAAVRLHRAREAAQRALAYHHREVAAAHGLLDSETAAGWQETRLWCCRCGVRRFWGILHEGDYALRCPECDPPGIGMRGLTTRASSLDGRAVLGGVSGFRAGLRRVHGWWQDYVTRALATRSASCIRCGALAWVKTSWEHSGGAPIPGFVAECSRCPERFYIAPSGLLFHAPEMAAFWQCHPRLRCLPMTEILFAGRPALLTGFADRQGAARLEMVFARDDLTTLSVRKS